MTRDQAAALATAPAPAPFRRINVIHTGRQRA